nr:9519_t:CDS:10 [Entrophospora candida]
MDFYKLNEVEDWTCIKVVEHYHANSEQKDWKKVLDSIKKDLKKDWTASMDKIDDRAQFKIEFQQHHQDVNTDVTAPTKKVKTSRIKTPERQIYLLEQSIEDCYEQSDSVEGNEEDGQPFLMSNDHDVEITHEDDNNPFIAKTGEGSMKCKVVLSWNHAITNVVINNDSENDLNSIEKLKANLTLSYEKEIDLILCLLSIMYCNEFKPEYIKCSKKAWNEALPRSLAPKMLLTIAHSVMIEYNMLLNDKQSLNTRWRENWAKGNTLLMDEDKDIFDCVQIVLRNFYNENKKLDEDTFIHRYCHQVLEEIFNKTEYSLIWANGESESSKARRLLDGHNHGRKPDFWILSKIDDTDKELIFATLKVMANTQSKIDLLKEENSKLIAEITELSKENVKVNAENIEIKAENAKLRQALEGHETRITKLEQGEKEKSITNTRSALLMKDVLQSPVNFNDTFEQIILQSEDALVSDISNNASNSDPKSLEDKEVNEFLDSVNKENVCNEIRERNWEKKLLHESAINKDLTSDNILSKLSNYHVT